jgi:hypothetical protein
MPKTILFNFILLCNIKATKLTHPRPIKVSNKEANKTLEQQQTFEDLSKEIHATVIFTIIFILVCIVNSKGSEPSYTPYNNMRASIEVIKIFLQDLCFISFISNRPKAKKRKFDTEATNKI